MYPRSTHIILASILACLFLWWLSVRRSHVSGPGLHGTDLTHNVNPFFETIRFDPPPAETDFLGHPSIANLTGSAIDYASLQIQVVQSDTETLRRVQPLAIQPPPFTTISPTDPIINLPSPSTATLLIASLPTTRPNLSTFLFGLATTYARLLTLLPIHAHWSAYTGARIIALMAPTQNETLVEAVQSLAWSLRIDLTIIEPQISPTYSAPLTNNPEFEFLDRYIHLLPQLYAHRTPEIQWFVFVDDDTFFPNPGALVTHFNKHYNASEPYYIGALSENFISLSQWGIMAYGGAGIFLSLPLMNQLAPHFDDCIGGERDTGDRKIAKCVGMYSDTKLTWDHRLHQIDLKDDQSGWWEANKEQPLSVHHWLSWEEFDVGAMSKIRHILGNDGILQKFVFTGPRQGDTGAEEKRYTPQYRSSDNIQRRGVSSCTDSQSGEAREGCPEDLVRSSDSTPADKNKQDISSSNQINNHNPVHDNAKTSSNTPSPESPPPIDSTTPPFHNLDLNSELKSNPPNPPIPKNDLHNGQNWYLTAGYSLVKYSSSFISSSSPDDTPRDLLSDHSTEQTWTFTPYADTRHYEHALSPIISKDEGKIMFKLESARVERDERVERGKMARGSVRVRQLYVRRTPWSESENRGREVSGVVEVVWRFA